MPLPHPGQSTKAPYLLPAIPEPSGLHRLDTPHCFFPVIFFPLAFHSSPNYNILLPPSNQLLEWELCILSQVYGALLSFFTSLSPCGPQVVIIISSTSSFLSTDVEYSHPGHQCHPVYRASPILFLLFQSTKASYHLPEHRLLQVYRGLLSINGFYHELL